MRDYSVRPYQPNDEYEIVELLKLVFEGWPNTDLKCSPSDHWKWKYLHNPSKTNFISICLNDGKMAGASHLLPLKIKIGTKILPCTLGADAVVHPNHRRMGIYKSMREFKFQLAGKAGFKINYAATSNPILIRYYDKNRRPRFPHTITNFVRIKNLNLQLEMMPIDRAWLVKLGYYTVKLANDLKNSLRRSKPAENNVRIREISHFDDRIDLFWQEVANHYDFIVERCIDYLNWRYCDLRAGEYVVNQAEDAENRVLGFCVLRINRGREDYPIGYVVDLLTLPDRLDVADILVAQAVRYFDEHRINIVNALIVRNHPYERVFSRYRFLDSRIKLQIYYNLLDDVDYLKGIEKTPSEKIHFSYGDIDSLPTEMPKYR